MKDTVIIDCFPENADRYVKDYAIVVIDVIRATTTATTAISHGKAVFPARTTDEAYAIASGLKDPLLVGELGGNMPYGFDYTNSPVDMNSIAGVNRPIVLVSSSGTQLLMNASGAGAVYISCFRNFSSVARHVAGMHRKVAVIGAGTHGQFRREDQMCCAWVAEKLLEAGYSPETKETTECVSRWSGASPEVVRGGRSASYLMRSGQSADLDFILSHIDDLDCVPSLVDGMLLVATGPSERANSR